MAKELSPSVRSILTLLHNINELLIISNKRQEAKDVMRAIEVYAKCKNVSIPEDKIEMFYSRLLDSRPITLSCLVSDIGHDVITSERVKSSKNKKTSAKDV